VLTIPYGALPDQVGDLYPSARAGAPLVCLLHGGFWRMPYGRDQLHPLALALQAAGLTTWNIGYRRVGPEGAPWPATLDDVRAAITFLPQLQHWHSSVALRTVFLIGHSAGGQLAFWAGAEAATFRLPYGLTGLVGLAPVLDLATAFHQDLGPGAVATFLGGTPETVSPRYAMASPAARLPLRTPQWILHGTLDTDVPPSMSRAYVAAARSAGDQVTFEEFQGVDHMGLIDPRGPSFLALRSLLSGA